MSSISAKAASSTVNPSVRNGASTVIAATTPDAKGCEFQCRASTRPTPAMPNPRTSPATTGILS
ncbi:Uncharacterised protein [Mycobacteroides abscessus subsp. abscessus]|nr:Uncharacterised protein [Mycobacteroides abscessus subsp. abscessus]